MNERPAASDRPSTSSWRMRSKVGRSPAGGMPKASVPDVVTACRVKQVGMICARGIIFQGPSVLAGRSGGSTITHGAYSLALMEHRGPNRHGVSRSPTTPLDPALTCRIGGSPLPLCKFSLRSQDFRILRSFEAPGASPPYGSPGRPGGPCRQRWLSGQRVPQRA
jgi:hypothetical protein